jgi:hypothetical protein
MCTRLTEAAAKAEARASAAEEELFKAGDQIDFLKKRFAEARKLLLPAFMALNIPPRNVQPHVAPRPRAAAVADRFSLLELE